jgi:hypothetical protein
MAQGYPAVLADAGVTEAAMQLGHRTYSGTVAATERQPEVESFASVSAAALSLGHRTYSGTVATTERLP